MCSLCNFVGLSLSCYLHSLCIPLAEGLQYLFIDFIVLYSFLNLVPLICYCFSVLAAAMARKKVEEYGSEALQCLHLFCTHTIRQHILFFHPAQNVLLCVVLEFSSHKCIILVGYLFNFARVFVWLLFVWFGSLFVSVVFCTKYIVVPVNFAINLALSEASVILSTDIAFWIPSFSTVMVFGGRVMNLNDQRFSNIILLKVHCHDCGLSHLPKWSVNNEGLFRVGWGVHWPDLSKLRLL